MENKNIEFEEVESVEEFSTLEDLETTYIKNPKVGEKVELVIKGFKVIKDKDMLEFTFEQNGKKKKASNALSNVDYGIQLHTNTGSLFWINSWKVWGMTKAIAKKLGNNDLKGIELQINHVANGMLEEHRDNAWMVKTKINGQWKSLNPTTNDWE